jgi:outer membrane protein
MSKILLGILSLAMSSSPVFAATRTLDDCFAAAIKRSETLATNIELIEQAEQQYKQARAGLFPTISGVASYLVQQSPPAGTATSFSPSEQTTAKLQGVQPIFHGLKEYAGLLATNLNISAAIANKVQAAATLYSDTVTSFYTILSLEQTLRDYQDEIDVYQERIVDLNHRIKIGRSKPSEVLTVRSAVDSLAAQAEVARGQLSAQREAFAFLTGLDRNEVLSETPVTEVKPQPLDFYLARVEMRPDVKASKATAEATEKNVAIARAGHFPSVDLGGDYYFKRPGLTSDVHWDVTLTASVPIFAGGLVNAQVSQAASQSRVADLALERTRRSADQDLRTNVSNVSTDLQQTEKLDRATRSALDNYKAQVRDYRLGLVTNIDVLQAITAWQEAKRALDAARYLSKLDFLKLETAAAIRPAQFQEEIKN